MSKKQTLFLGVVATLLLLVLAGLPYGDFTQTAMAQYFTGSGPGQYAEASGGFTIAVSGYGEIPLSGSFFIPLQEIGQCTMIIDRHYIDGGETTLDNFYEICFERAGWFWDMSVTFTGDTIINYLPGHCAPHDIDENTRIDSLCRQLYNYGGLWLEAK